MLNTILQGDCAHALIRVPSQTVDLIVTSPPYAERRKHTYGGVPPHEYAHWFKDRAYQFKRVLKPTGSFILNIKEHAHDGERHPYVLELVLALREWGWRWVDEFIWHKKTCYPGKFPNRLKDAWEHCYHFAKEKKIAFYPDAVRVPAAESTVKRHKTLSEQDKRRIANKTNSGFGQNRSQMAGVFEPRSQGKTKGNGGMNIVPDDLTNRKKMALPSNVLHLSPQGKNVGHSAAFPETLPEFFIKLFTKEGELVLDPFCGSGTSCLVAQRLGRNFLGVELLPENVKLSLDRLEQEQKKRAG